MEFISEVSNLTDYDSDQIKRVAEWVCTWAEARWPKYFASPLSLYIQPSNPTQRAWGSGALPWATYNSQGLHLHTVKGMHVAGIADAIAYAVFGVPPEWTEYVQRFEDPIALAVLYEVLGAPKSGFITRRGRRGRRRPTEPSTER